MSIVRDKILKNKSLSNAVNDSLIKSSPLKVKGDLNFLTEIKSNILYRKKKVDEFTKIDKVINKPRMDMDESSTFSSEEKRNIIKNQKKHFVKLNYKKIIEKRSKTFRNKLNVNESQLPELSKYQRHIVKLQPKNLKFQGKDMFNKNSNSPREIKIRIKEAAKAVFYSISIKNNQIFENYLRRISGINRDFEILLVKVYKNYFDIDRNELSLETIFDKLSENSLIFNRTDGLEFRSNNNDDDKRENYTKFDMKHNINLSSTYYPEMNRTKPTFSYNKYYRFQNRKETYRELKSPFKISSQMSKQIDYIRDYFL